MIGEARGEEEEETNGKSITDHMPCYPVIDQ